MSIIPTKEQIKNRELLEKNKNNYVGIYFVVKYPYLFGIIGGMFISPLILSVIYSNIPGTYIYFITIGWVIILLFLLYETKQFQRLVEGNK